MCLDNNAERRCAKLNNLGPRKKRSRKFNYILLKLIRARPTNVFNYVEVPRFPIFVCVHPGLRID